MEQSNENENIISTKIETCEFFLMMFLWKKCLKIIYI